MASSAAHISVSTGASVHAPQSKTHNKASQGDSFADMLATADAPEDKPRADAAPSKEKAAPAEKPAADKTEAADNAANTRESRKAPEDGQANETAPVADDAAAKDATVLADAQSDTQADILSDALPDPNAANDNNATDVTVPQATQPAPAPQPAAIPVQFALATNTTQTATNDEAGAGSADAELAPVAGTNSAPAPAARPQDTQTQPAAGNDKAAGIAQHGTDAAAGKTAQAQAGDFEQVLQDANLPGETAETAAATADAVKTAETPAAPAAKPSPELNTISLAAPATPTHAAPGNDKLAATAQATPAPHAPQPTPDVNQFAVDVAARSQSGSKQFDIRLDPPELGRVEVRLSIDAHGKAEAHLTADQPQTLELLQKDAPALARALRDAGLNVNQDALNFSLKNQQQQAGGDHARSGARHGFNNSGNGNEPRIEEAAAYVRRSLGVLDIRV